MIIHCLHMSMVNTTRWNPLSVSATGSSSRAKRRYRVAQPWRRATTLCRGDHTKPCVASERLLAHRYCPSRHTPPALPSLRGLARPSLPPDDAPAHLRASPTRPVGSPTCLRAWEGSTPSDLGRVIAGLRATRWRRWKGSAFEHRSRGRWRAALGHPKSLPQV